MNKSAQAAERCVLFIDVLGFANLTESFPTTTSEDLAMYEHFDFDPTGRKPVEGPQLRSTLVEFHESIRRLLDANLSGYELVSFSDSCYLCPTDDDQARMTMTFGTYLMRELITRHIPARIGIGFGTFVRYKFGVEETAYRKTHEARFFGTGVVRAYRAEANGPKGLRVLLHPSMIARTPSRERREFVVKLPPEESTENAGHEIDYFTEDKYSDPHEQELLSHLGQMSESGKRAAHHYEATFKAWRRFAARRNKRGQ
jgi:hypothetical protein